MAIYNLSNEVNILNSCLFEHLISI